MDDGSRLFRYLDPGDALAEVLFGLIMVLTITVGTGLLAGETGLNARDLIIAAVGCNLAWGVIDGAFFILGSLFYRSRRARFFRDIRGARSEAAAMAAIQEEFALDDEPLAALPDDQARLHQSILMLASHAPPARVTLRRSDLMAAAFVFVLVSITAVPAILPFLLFQDARLALRVSNLVLILLLFVVGYFLARFAGARPIYVGMAVMLVGIAMVCLAVVLGG